MPINSCRICGAELDVAIRKLPIGWICELCNMKLSPPRATFRVRKSNLNDGFYSETTKANDSIITLKDLSKCGWFFRSIHIDKLGTVLIKAEFNGNVNCGRVSRYYNYPNYFQRCGNRVCSAGGIIGE